MSVLSDKNVDLFRKFRQQGKPQWIRERICKLNSGLVGRAASKLLSKFQGITTVCFEDLYQVGTLGMLAAIEKYDPDSGHTFSTFAMPYIEGRIMNYFRDKSSAIRQPRRLYDTNQKINGAISYLSRKLKRQPTVREVAIFLVCQEHKVPFRPFHELTRTKIKAVLSKEKDIIIAREAYNRCNSYVNISSVNEQALAGQEYLPEFRWRLLPVPTWFGNEDCKIEARQHLKQYLLNPSESNRQILKESFCKVPLPK